MELVKYQRIAAGCTAIHSLCLVYGSGIRYREYYPLPLPLPPLPRNPFLLRGSLANSLNDVESDAFTLEHTTDFEDLIPFVYPDRDCDHRHFLCGSAILSKTNVTIDVFNDEVVDMRSRTRRHFLQCRSTNS